MGFLGSSAGKESACNAGDPSLSPAPPWGSAKDHPILPLKTPACDLARGAGVESKQKCVVFCVDLINTVLSSLYGQVRLYYSHDK